MKQSKIIDTFWKYQRGALAVEAELPPSPQDGIQLASSYQEAQALLPGAYGQGGQHGSPLQDHMQQGCNRPGGQVGHHAGCAQHPL